MSHDKQPFFVFFPVIGKVEQERHSTPFL